MQRVQTFYNIKDKRRSLISQHEIEKVARKSVQPPTCQSLLILLMQLQSEENQNNQPFEIVYNARNSKPSRSRKSSTGTFNVIDKDKCKIKKLRKMTMNDGPKRYQEIKQIKELQRDQRQIHSQKGESKEEQPINIQDYFDFTNYKKFQMQAEDEQLCGFELEKGISCGVLNERELDSDFNLMNSEIIQEQQLMKI